MCEIAKSERRTYRDQDPPRKETTRSRHSSESENASSYDVESDSDFFGRERQRILDRVDPASFLIASKTTTTQTFQRDSDHHSASADRNDASAGQNHASAGQARLYVDGHWRDDSSSDESAIVKQVPYNTLSLSTHDCGKKIVEQQAITNGVKREENSCEILTNGREMAPVMGVPPPPPPAPHMGPDGLILPRKPYNPCLISNNHKDLRRELLFNQKIGRNVLNQKSELQRALEKQREATMRKEAEKNHEETYKDDPRTALQRALEQRARHIRLMEQPRSVEAPNPLVHARAKLRTRTDSQ